MNYRKKKKEGRDKISVNSRCRRVDRTGHQTGHERNEWVEAPDHQLSVLAQRKRNVTVITNLQALPMLCLP